MRQPRTDPVPRLAAALLLLLVVAAAAPASAEKLWSEKRFTRAFVTRMLQMEPACKAKVAGPLEVRYQVGDTERTAFLDNAYAAYTQSPTERDEIVRHYATSALAMDTPTASPATAGTIVPVIRSSSYLAGISGEIARLGGDPAADLPVHEPLNGELTVMYVIDTPTSMAFLLPSQLPEFGVSPKELRARAIDNLVETLPPLEVRTGDGILMIIADGNYESSLLLLDSLWAPGGLPLEGELVVAVPTRDVLLITRRDDAASVARVRGAAEELATTGTYAISPQLFVRKDGSWVVLPR